MPLTEPRPRVDLSGRGPRRSARGPGDVRPECVGRGNSEPGSCHLQVEVARSRSSICESHWVGIEDRQGIGRSEANRAIVAGGCGDAIRFKGGDGNAVVGVRNQRIWRHHDTEAGSRPSAGQCAADGAFRGGTVDLSAVIEDGRGISGTVAACSAVARAGTCITLACGR